MPGAEMVAGAAAGIAMNELWDQLKNSDKSRAEFERNITGLLEKIAQEAPDTLVDLSLSRVEQNHTKMRAKTLIVTNASGAAITARLRVGTSAKMVVVVGATSTTSLGLGGILFDRGVPIVFENVTGAAYVADVYAYVLGSVERDTFEPSGKEIN